MRSEFGAVRAAIDGLRGRVPFAQGRRGPVPLAKYFAETGLDHVELPGLTRGAIADYLRCQGIRAEDPGDPNEELAGFIFTAGRAGWSFISAKDPLPRRRFTAAHELGHFVLHRATMGRFRADSKDTLREADENVTDQMEREANRFAAVLLMPEEICRAREEEMRRPRGSCPRGVLRYRLSSELLVSREAVQYRLQELGVGDE